jgi:hypothetical protein
MWRTNYLAEDRDKLRTETYHEVRTGQSGWPADIFPPRRLSVFAVGTIYLAVGLEPCAPISAPEAREDVTSIARQFRMQRLGRVKIAP